MKILMVCLGNICRSPLAEGILRHKATKSGLNWLIDSAGTAAHNPGCVPHFLSQQVARINDVVIGKQKCRQLLKNDIERFDKIYVMDEENYYDVKQIAGNKWNSSKVDYLLNEIYPGENRDIFDPWYGGVDGFHQVYTMIDEACDAILRKYMIYT